MVANLDTIFHYVILPLMSAQLFLVVALYFTFVGRHVINRISLFNIFIATYIFYLVGHSAQIYTKAPVAFSILYIRMTLFLTVGLPSLLLFLCYQCGIQLPRIARIVPYIFGFLMSIIYVIGSDALHQNMMFSPDYLQLFGFTVIGANHLDAEMAALLLLSLLPSGYLLYRELTNDKRLTCIAFLLGALIISLLYIVGLYQRFYWLYYIGSMSTALYWIWAVYADVKQTKSRAQQLNETLHHYLLLGAKDLKPVLTQVLVSIEEESTGNLERYKLKVRELLNELTDTTIEAGGDANSLLKRNHSKIQVILDSDNPDEIRQIAEEETTDLTTMITELPVKRSEKIVTDTKSFIENNFQDAIEVSELAAAVNVSQSYLIRCFKKATGQTIKQYLTHCRIEKAKELLKDNKVSDTGFAVGFNDSNYFGNVFKRQLGLTPQQYKKKHYS